MKFKHKFSKPIFRPGSEFGQFKKRPPKPLSEMAKGKHIQFVFPALNDVEQFEVDRKVGEFVEFSYNTADPFVLSRRAIIGNQKYVDFCDSLSDDTFSLDDTVINSYARKVYDLSLQEYTDSTGLPSAQKTHAAYMNIEHSRTVKLEPIWKQWQHQCGIFDISNELYPESYATNDLSLKAMDYRVGFLINWWLQENDIKISLEDRTRLVRATDAYAHQVLHGSTIQVSGSHVQSTAKARSGQPATKSWTLTEIFDRWAKHEADNKDTVRKWRTVLVRLIKFLGHEIANDVEKVDIQDWRAELENSGRAMNTINGQDIPATKRIFSYGFEMDLISKNPAANMSYVKKAKKMPDKTGYTDDEVVKIINAAKSNTSADLKWIPQLAAYVGARVSEVAQIHASQIKKDELSPHIWTIEIENTKKGQSLKNEGSNRVVPLYPKLFGAEFIAFVASRKGKFLFSDLEFDPRRKTPHFASTINKSRRWIRRLGFDDANKSPHHAFRHWWKGRAEDKNLNQDLIEYIQGHSGSRKNSNRMYRKTPAQAGCLELIEAVFAGLDIE